jgi:hypothetical protein
MTRSLTRSAFKVWTVDVQSDDSHTLRYVDKVAQKELKKNGRGRRMAERDILRGAAIARAFKGCAPKNYINKRHFSCPAIRAVVMTPDVLTRAGIARPRQCALIAGAFPTPVEREDISRAFAHHLRRTST